MNTIIRAKGLGFISVEFDGEAVTITRGLMSRLGKSVKTIHVRNIQAVQFKPASWFGNGFIAFTVAGGNERQSRPNRQALGASKDENAAPFGLKSKDDFQALHDAVNAAIQNR